MCKTWSIQNIELEDSLSPCWCTSTFSSTNVCFKVFSLIKLTSHIELICEWSTCLVLKHVFGLKGLRSMLIYASEWARNHSIEHSQHMYHTTKDLYSKNSGWIEYTWIRIVWHSQPHIPHSLVCVIWFACIIYFYLIAGLCARSVRRNGGLLSHVPHNSYLSRNTIGIG